MSQEPSNKDSGGLATKAGASGSTAAAIAKQVAEALEAGVIHRDLKPAKIKVKDDGTVKVLEFGLAKALDPSREGDPSQSPTLTAAATQMGVIMGTAAYMSPEQAGGKVVDRRADVWAFGVVLYELLRRVWRLGSLRAAVPGAWTTPAGFFKWRHVSRVGERRTGALLPYWAVCEGRPF